jgi:hypothetical protein
MAQRHKFSSRRGRRRMEYTADSAVQREADDERDTFRRGGRPKAKHRDLKGTGSKSRGRADRLPRGGSKSGEGRLEKAALAHHPGGLVIIEEIQPHHRADGGTVGHYGIGGVIAEFLGEGAEEAAEGAGAASRGVLLLHARQRQHERECDEDPNCDDED